MTTMKIAIIGAGNVGSALGPGWAAAGHEIVFGVRDPNDAKVQEVVRSVGGRARAATVRDVVAPSEVGVLATPWPAAKDALTAAASLHGKTLVDATNPLTPDLSGLVLGHTTSAAEQVARGPGRHGGAWLPGGHRGLAYQRHATLGRCGHTSGSAVPLTLLVIKPVNDVLMSPDAHCGADVEGAVARWERLHLIRTVASGTALVCCLSGFNEGHRRRVPRRRGQIPHGTSSSLLCCGGEHDADARVAEVESTPEEHGDNMGNSTCVKSGLPTRTWVAMAPPR
jgi:NADP oxidoreductase coenzyme F420-dependent/Domain of unknown function (DUF1772)